jgi:lipid A ethanolaminephosphotransferase
MFSPFGRSDYDETRIRRHESVLQVLSRAGFRVVWLDNQSGCKGVCAGLETHDLSHANVAPFCRGGSCYDDILLHGLRTLTAGASEDLVVVLHQLGNHGPAYFRRYPPELRRFTPTCETNDLGACTREQIVNAYDNAILYTDRLLSALIADLSAMAAHHDVVLGYVSDHGESLGENGIYLHGLPYAVAPAEQLEVPMLWWLPPDSARSFAIDLQCMQGRSTSGASHDNLYHSLLGLLGVETLRYRPERDLFAPCRKRLEPDEGLEARKRLSPAA